MFKLYRSPIYWVCITHMFYLCGFTGKVAKQQDDNRGVSGSAHGDA